MLKRVLIATGARSPLRDAAGPAGSWELKPWPSIPRPTRRPSTSSWLPNRCASVRPRPPKAISTRPLCSPPPWLPDATASIPAMGFCLKTADFADSLRRRGADLHRSLRRHDPQSRLQVCGPRSHAGCRRTGNSRLRRARFPLWRKPWPRRSPWAIRCCSKPVPAAAAVVSAAATTPRSCPPLTRRPRRKQGLLRRRRDVPGEAGSGPPAH